MLSVNALSGGIFLGGNAVMVEFIDVISVLVTIPLVAKLSKNYSTSFPGSFISPPQRGEGRKTLAQAGHVSWWQIYLHGRGPNLWKYCRRCCLLPPTINRLSGQPWKTLFRFRSEDLSYQVHCFQHLEQNCIWKLWKDKNVKLWRLILFDTRCLIHKTCSVAALLNKKRTVLVLLFALPMAWASIKLTNWVV